MAGVLWALAAGLMWGLAFVAPLLLPGYTAIEIAAGRYVAYGVFSVGALAFAAMQGSRVGLSDRRVWLNAFALTLVGNLVYFACVTAGVQRAGAPIVALIIGTLPVLLPIAASFGEPKMQLGRLVLPSLLMLAGLAAVHVGENGGENGGVAVAGNYPLYWSGIGLTLAALLSWTWYGVANARALKARPDVTAATWSSLQGVTLLPIALPVLALAVMVSATHPAGRPGWESFAGVSILLGVATSWVAMWCWNRASQLLSAPVVGQLIVFETLAALLYAYAWKMAWPPLLVVAGSALLIGGVILGLRRLQSNAT